MRTAPVDQTALGLVVNSIEPKPDFDNPQVQARNKAGVPQWWVHCIPAAGDPLRVTVALAHAPELRRFQPVAFAGLMCGASAGRLWFSADGIEEVSK